MEKYMPDKDGVLTKEESEIVQKFLLEKFGPHNESPTCEMCKKRAWVFLDKLARAQHHPAIVKNGIQQVLPMLVLICQNCGNMKFISALKIGIILEDKNEPSLEMKN